MVIALVAGGCSASRAATTATVALPTTVTSAPSTTTAAPPPTRTTAAPRVPARGRAYAAQTYVAPAPAAPRVITAPALTQTASLHGDTERFAYPGGPSLGTIPGTWYGYQSILPVIDQAPDWVEVRLAQRPNFDVTWVRARDVDLTPDAYYLVLDLPTRHLLVFQSGELVGSFPAGIGTYDDPTPSGPFFVAFRAPPPNDSYGPFMLVTSAHSDAINNWEGMGDAITAIHGPITASADAQIGTTGARISHGCIRLHDWDVIRLLGIPPGTPLDILG